MRRSRNVKAAASVFAVVAMLSSAAAEKRDFIEFLPSCKRFAKDVEPCTDPNEKPPKLGVRRAGRDDSNATDRIRRDFNREQIAELEDRPVSSRHPTLAIFR